MPFDDFRQRIHIQQKKNQQVLHNVARLHKLAQQAQSTQQILDGLHPWGKNPRLTMDNHLHYWLFSSAWICNILIFFLPYKVSLFFLSMILALLAIVYYEGDYAVKSALKELEKTYINKKYQLDFNQLPSSLPAYHHESAISLLKQKCYPLLNQGDGINHFAHYAGTHWTDNLGRQYPVLIFHYYFTDKNIKTAVQYQFIKQYPPFAWIIKFITNLVHIHTSQATKDSQQERHLWGVMMFDVDLAGFAVSTENQYFPDDYVEPWKTSDIQFNQRVYIYGEDSLTLAKQITPHLTLGLNQLFAQRKGHLFCHPTDNMLCFLGEENLFELHSPIQKIEDISHLRGHLRRCKMTHYEHLQRDLLQLVQNSSNIQIIP